MISYGQAQNDYYRPEMDVFSLLLGAMRLRSSLLARFDSAGAWSIDCGDASGLAAYFVLSGGCLFVPDRGEEVELREGCVLILPEWRKHRLCSSREVEPVTITEAATKCGKRAWDQDNPLGDIIFLTHGDGADTLPSVRIMTMIFRVADDAYEALAASLPPVCSFDATSSAVAPLIRMASEFLAEEAEDRSVGYSAASHKLAEFLFIQLLRGMVESQPDGLRGWLRGLSSPPIARAMASIHRSPDHGWTVASLAESVHMSRSAFASAFSRAINKSPMEYLRTVRMQLAAERLEKGHSVKEVAAGLGYATAFGLHKAFKQQFGYAPGARRRKPARAG